jgi:hypothetical protein
MTATAEPATNRQTHLPPEQTWDEDKAYLVMRMAEDIGSHFQFGPGDRTVSRVVTWKVIASYAPACEAEVLDAARVVSLSLFELDLMREAARPGTDLETKLRIAASVVSLDKAACQSAGVLARRQGNPKPLRQPTAARRTGRDPRQAEAVETMAKAALDEYYAAQAAQRAAGQPADTPAPDKPEPVAAQPGSTAGQPDRTGAAADDAPASASEAAANRSAAGGSERSGIMPPDMIAGFHDFLAHVRASKLPSGEMVPGGIVPGEMTPEDMPAAVAASLPRASGIQPRA